MRDLYIIARIKKEEKGKVVGYMVANTHSKEVGVISESQLMSVIEDNKINLRNGEIREGSIVITQGSAEKYPTMISTTGEFEDNNYAYTVLGRNIDDGYVVVNPTRQIVEDMGKRNILKTARTKGLTNAKVVKDNIVSKRGSLNDIIGFNYNYLEKDFKTPNNSGLVDEWRVRIIKENEPYGLNGKLINDKGTLVEFITLETNQFVGRYYIDTILEGETGINLYGEVPSWSIDSENMEKIRNWLRKQGGNK